MKLGLYQEKTKNYPFLLIEETFNDVDHMTPKKARMRLKTILRRLSFRQTEFDWLMLSMSEIISNLIKHPKVKPSLVKVSIYASSLNKIMLDISDNSTPFYEFEVKKNQSIHEIQFKKFNESGRGLALIAKTHPDHAYVLAEEARDGLNHFTIWYPPRELFEDAEHSDKEPQGFEEEPVKALLPTTQNPKKVFVVDDDRIIREILEQILKDDYHVYPYECGEDALEEFDLIKPDMIISDLIMPGMSGGELRQALSRKEGGDMTPFVFLSGNKDAATTDYINKLGIDDYLFKPVKKERLLSVVERLLLRSSQVKNDIQGRVSSNITEILKPSLPSKVGRWKTAVRTVNAATGGGDFLFHKNFEDEKQDLVVIADVMGHGLEAKFFSYAFAGYLRSVFYGACDRCDPSLLLQLFSQTINRDPVLENTIITSQAFGLFDSGLVSCASAAHPKPYIYKAQEKKLIQLDVAGPLPGVIGDRKYKTFNFTVEKGDVIIFFTDGMYETVGEDLSLLELENCFQDILLRSKTNKLSKIIDEIWYFYLEQIRPHQREDDSTVVLLEYLGDEEKDTDE